MRNDINAIKNELIEQTNEQKQRELDRKAKKKLAEFKELCRAIIYTSINDSIKNGASIDDIYLQRDYIVEMVLNDIKSKYIEIEDMNSLYDRTIKVREYPYKDYEIIDILLSLFDKEYLRVKKRLKEEHLILKNDLQKKLKERFIDIIENDTPSECSYLSMIKSLSLIDSKDEVINEITDAEKEKSILESIYYQTLNEVKKSYINSVRYKTADKEKLALPWKIIVGYKAIGKLWKM
jgi:hypothetical protein